MIQREICRTGRAGLSLLPLPGAVSVPRSGPFLQAPSQGVPGQHRQEQADDPAAAARRNSPDRLRSAGRGPGGPRCPALGAVPRTDNPTQKAPQRPSQLRKAATFPLQCPESDSGINGLFDSHLAKLETGEMDRDLRPRKSKAQPQLNPPPVRGLFGKTCSRPSAEACH